MKQPLLRWAGSKRRLLPQLAPFWREQHERYVEPFAGSACLFFALEPGKAALNDINPHLIRTYRTLACRADDVYDQYLRLPRSRDYYYSIRKSAFFTEDDVLASAHFLYLNRNCFNGLYRTNKLGEFNVPFSDRRTGQITDRDTFLQAAELLSKAAISCEDFEVFLLETARPSDLVYLDPPYAIRNSRAFTQYGPDTFGINDLRRLSDVLVELDKRQVSFLLSYADCPEAREVFSKWRFRATSVQRNISGFSAHRRKSGEILVFGEHLSETMAEASGSTR